MLINNFPRHMRKRACKTKTPLLKIFIGFTCFSDVETLRLVIHLNKQ